MNEWKERWKELKKYISENEANFRIHPDFNVKHILAKMRELEGE